MNLLIAFADRFVRMLLGISDVTAVVARERAERAERELLGRGVGMAVVRSTCASLGGTVAITSQPGRGTTFRLSIPRPDVALRVAN